MTHRFNNDDGRVRSLFEDSTQTVNCIGVETINSIGFGPVPGLSGVQSLRHGDLTYLQYSAYEEYLNSFYDAKGRNVENVQFSVQTYCPAIGPTFRHWVYLRQRSIALTSFKIQNELFAKRVRDSFARQGFMEHLGARIDNIVAGKVEIIVPFEKHLSQQHGFFHGGLIGTIGDNAGGYSAFTLMAETDSVLTVEYKLNIMAPAMGELLIARGRVLRPGRTLTVCQSDIFVVREGVEKPCATLLGTFMTMANASDEPSANN